MTTAIILWYGVLFILGLVFGSFGSVLSSRLSDFSFPDIFGHHTSQDHKKRKQAIKGILRGRSHCPYCKHQLHGKDLIPIISYLGTGGKCRYCKSKISSLYIWREIGCGLLFVIIGGILSHTIGVSLTILILRLLLIRISYLLLVHDIQTMHLHEPLWLLLLLLSVLFIGYLPGSWFAGYVISALGGRYYALIFAGIFLLFFLAFYWFARLYVRWRTGQDSEGFGSGDVRIAPLLGVQFGAREYFLQLQYTITGEGFSRVIAIQHFSYYVILAGILCFIYAGLQKRIAPGKSIRELPFFTGMISAVRVMMVLTWFNII